jgi:hypothetical protein
MEGVDRDQVTRPSRGAADDGGAGDRPATRARAEGSTEGELAVTVTSALRSRRRVLEEVERKAAIALTQMIATEGLAVTEAIEWVGDAS